MRNLKFLNNRGCEDLKMGEGQRNGECGEMTASAYICKDTTEPDVVWKSCQECEAGNVSQFSRSKLLK